MKNFGKIKFSEPRFIQFDVYLKEFPEELYGNNPCVDLAFGHAVSDFYSNKIDKNFNKWEITMNEIIDEN